MSTQRHMIKKQILELQLRSRERAFQIQNAVSRVYRNKVVPQIEACCNEFSDPTVIHRIEMLELDLGTIALENLEETFPEQVERQLRQRFAEQIRGAGASSPASSSTPPKTSQPAAQPELVSYFLRTGTLPWWAGTLSKEDLETRVDQLIASSPDAVKTLLAESVRHERSLKRLISQFSDAILLKATTVFSPGLSQFVGDYLNDIDAIVNKTAVFEGIPQEKFRLEHWRGILVNLSLTGRATPGKLWLVRDSLMSLAANLGMNYASLISRLHQVVQQLKKAGIRFRSDFPELLSEVYQEIQPLQPAAEKSALSDLGSSEAPPLRAAYLRDIEAIFRQTEGVAGEIRLEDWQKIVRTLPVAGSAAADKLRLARDIVLSLAASSVIPSTNLVSRLHQAVQRLKKRGVRFISDFPDMLLEIYQGPQPVQPTDISDRLKGSEDLFSDSEEIYISNSGLILLWPFLKRFFETLGLVRENNFMNTKAAERAVLILQYVTDGSTEIPEHLLSLNKILCGIDLLEPVEARFELSEHERTECENLLSAVIQHWAALKNTSVSGFQWAFLQREGVLSVRDGGWLLRVERQTHDVLLEKLPWGLGIVKLPWMEVILAVEW